MSDKKTANGDTTFKDFAYPCSADELKSHLSQCEEHQDIVLLVNQDNSCNEEQSLRATITASGMMTGANK